MADAKRCDRCEAFYEPTIGREYTLERDDNHDTTNPVCDWEEYDLCPSCYQQLYEFIVQSGE